MNELRKTVEYFDQEIPSFSEERYLYCIEAIKKLSTEDSSLIDIGCGEGNILHYINKQTNISKIAGIDPSLNLLNKAKEKGNYLLYQGSILDNLIVKTVNEKFDFALIGAVLHHLVGRTRQECYSYAKLSIANTINLVKTGGYIFIYEPVFSPKISMSIVFYIKKVITAITSSRLGGENNLGAPVVSYFTKEQLLELIKSFGNLKIINVNSIESRVTKFMRLVGIKKKYSLTIVIKKT